MSELAARVTELEVKLGFAEDLIETLNQTIFRQQEQLDLLQRQLIELNRRVQSAEAHEQRDPSEELPPHY